MPLYLSPTQMIGLTTLKGTAAARPAASIAGRLYYATDTETLSRDNGSSWDTIATSIGQLPAASAVAAADLMAVSQSGTTRQATITQLIARVQASMIIPFARIYQSSAQNVNTATTTTITFDGSSDDNDSMWNAGSPTILTIKTAGVYQARGAVSFSYDTAGQRFIQIERVGDGLTMGSINTPSSGEMRLTIISDPTTLAVNDQIRLRVYQDSGSTLTTVASSVQTTLSLFRLSV